ncbi:hypothetical protein Taro_052440 [Colocasia esculenta]|uniref:Uncharacterized protein n=1 Tax=Colocasia esculenta TaxID=4460 RepID=A0A843XIG3_COLES|nr:hypothetical protein [Colocasia esculenta]
MNVWMDFKLRLEGHNLMERLESTTIRLQYCWINTSRSKSRRGASRAREGAAAIRRGACRSGSSWCATGRARATWIPRPTPPPPDYRIPLTPPGVRQAREAGRRIRDVLASSCSPNWKVYFYVSPYERTLSTLRELGRAFPRRRILGERSVSEQDFSNFQVERMHVIKATCELFGRFFFRFP